MSEGAHRAVERRKLRRWPLASAAAIVVGGASALAAWVVSLGPVPLGDKLDYSTMVLDREGRLLRPFATLAGRWRLPVRVADVDRRYVDLLVAYEDKRFRSHHGIDPLALEITLIDGKSLPLVGEQE